MRRRIIVSPAEKRNVTIDRCPPIKSREICTSPDFPDPISSEEMRRSVTIIKVTILNFARQVEYLQAIREREQTGSFTLLCCAQSASRLHVDSGELSP